MLLENSNNWFNSSDLQFYYKRPKRFMAVASKWYSLLWEYCPGPAWLGLALKRCLHVTVWKVISNCPGASSEGKWVVVLWPQFNHKYFLRPGPRWSWAFYSLVAFCYQTLKTALDSLDTVDTLVEIPLNRNMNMLSEVSLYLLYSFFWNNPEKEN